MAGKRKFGGKRSTAGTKFRRTNRSNFRSGKESVISTSRTFDAGSIEVASADRRGAYSFGLSALPNYTDFTAAFNEYMITGAKVMFVPDFNSNAFDGVNAKNMPMLVTCLDWNDDTPPANQNEVLSDESCVVHTPGVRAERFLKPRCASAVWQSGVATGFGSLKRQWLDVNSAGVKHYGLKYAITRQVDTPGDLWSYRVYIKLYMKFKKML